MSLNVLTYNIRFVMDRHREREPLFSEAIKGETGKEHDVVGCQEVQNGGAIWGQDVRLRKAMPEFKFDSGPCFPTYVQQIPVLGWLFWLVWASPIGILLRDMSAVSNDYVLERFLMAVDGPALFHTPVLGEIVYFLLGSGWLFGNLIGAKEALEPHGAQHWGHLSHGTKDARTRAQG
mmetsp:Transcript_18092/g.29344  ORF Transcript_18092/g.29344 Transcript_18092/m.29344 type:complete len:177 (-) Transcript_18092:1080-1610(-)